MAFKIMTKSEYPLRLWSLIGYPGSGKSTFAAHMRGPILPVDADHRFGEVLDVAGDTRVYELSAQPADHVDPDAVVRLLAANMPGSDVRTIVVDSLTAIIAPLVVQAMVDKDRGRETNLAAAFRKKALAMRQLQDGVTGWGVDVLWIYHLQDARDEKAREVVRATVSRTELARLQRSINMQLKIVEEGGKRGVQVVWSCRGRSGITLWDESGSWLGMPEKVEEAVYDGLTRADQDKIEGATPKLFPSPEVAIAWGQEQGAFKDLLHARNTYDKVKRENGPRTAEEMAALWVAEVHARLAHGEIGNGHDRADCLAQIEDLAVRLAAAGDCVTIDPAFLDTGSTEELDVFVAHLQNRLDTLPIRAEKPAAPEQEKLL